MNASIALVAVSALILPTATLLAPAQAAGVAGGTITNCQKSKFGVTVRVKMRDNGEFTRVRVSHRHGTGNFYEPRVRSTSARWGQIGTAVSLPRRGSATTREIASTFDPGPGPYTSPTFRVPSGGGLSVDVKFHLTDGRRIALVCRDY